MYGTSRRLLPVAGILAALLLLPALAGAQTPDLSGTWVYDAGRSNVPETGGRGGMGGGDIVIKHAGSSVTTTRTMMIRGESTTFSTTFTTDGKPSEAAGFGGRGGGGTITAKWDGQKLIVSTVRSMGDQSFTTTDTYTLKDEGKTLVVEGTQRTRDGGQQAVSRVYTRK